MLTDLGDAPPSLCVGSEGSLRTVIRESYALENRICEEEAREETFLSFLLVSAGPRRWGLWEVQAVLDCVGKLLIIYLIPSAFETLLFQRENCTG